MTVAGIIVSGKSTPGLRQQKQIGSSELGSDLQRARHDPRVKAVVLRVDSPGANPLSSHCACRHLSAVATLAVQKALRSVIHNSNPAIVTVACDCLL